MCVTHSQNLFSKLKAKMHLTRQCEKHKTLENFFIHCGTVFEAPLNNVNKSKKYQIHSCFCGRWLFYSNGFWSITMMTIGGRCNYLQHFFQICIETSNTSHIYYIYIHISSGRNNFSFWIVVYHYHYHDRYDSLISDSAI